MRHLLAALGVTLLTSFAALAQPVCDPARAPNALQCLPRASNFQPSDSLWGVQANGPDRPNETVQVPPSALLSMDHSISPVTVNGLTQALPQFLASFLTHAASNAALSAMSTLWHPLGVWRLGYASPGDGPVIYFTGFGSACPLNGGLGDGGVQVPSSNGGCWIASQTSGPLSPRTWGAKGDGTTDDTAAFTAALAYCGASGATLIPGPHQYLISSADLFVPSNCTFSGASSPLFENHWVVGNTLPLGPLFGVNYTITPDTLVFANGHGLHQLAGSNVEHLTLRTPAVTGETQATTLRIGLNILASYAGIGITYGTTLTSGDGDDAQTHDVVVLGFSTCFYSSQNSRLRGDGLRGDCTNGLSVDNSHDWSDFEAEFFPASMLISTLPFEICSVTNASNNGAGYVRLTETCPTTTAGYSPPQTGDMWSVWGIQGVPAYGVFPITYIGTTGSTVTVDLPTVPFSGSYAGGGSMGMSLINRTGTAFSVTHSEATTIHAKEFGWAVGFNFGTGSLGTRCFPCDLDRDTVVVSNTGGGIQMNVAGDSYENYAGPGYVADYVSGLAVGGYAAQRPNKVVGIDFIFQTPGSCGISILSGDTILTGNAVQALNGLGSDSGTNTLCVSSSINSLILTGNYMPGVTLQPASSSPLPITKSANVLAVAPPSLSGGCAGASLGAGSDEDAGSVTSTSTMTSCTLTWVQPKKLCDFTSIGSNATPWLSSPLGTTVVTANFSAPVSGFTYQCN